MTNSLLIGKVIYSRLQNALSDNVNKKIFPLVAENGTTYPYVVYMRTNISVNKSSKDGYCEDACNYQIIAISDKYNESIDIANDIRRVMEKQRIITDDLVLNDNKLISAIERYTNDAYIQELTFACKIEDK